MNWWILKGYRIWGRREKVRYKITEDRKMLIRISDDFKKVFYQILAREGLGKIQEEKLIDFWGLQLGFYVNGVEHKLDDFEIID